MSGKDNGAALGVSFGLLAGAAAGILMPSLGIVMGAGYGMLVGIVIGALIQSIRGKDRDD